MSDETEIETEDEAEYFDDYSDPELFATASYGSHAAEIAQAFGNLTAQALNIPLNHPFHAPALEMLNRLVAQLEAKPKGSMRALKGD